MIFELREYTAADGAHHRLADRFEQHTFSLFERHGVRLIDFWVDRDDPRRIVYLAGFDDEQQRTAAWAAFAADPQWQRVKAESERAGPIVAEMRSTVLQRPAFAPTPGAADAR